MIFLFEAFLATMLAEQYDKLSQPILALEEPESHLHPCATRSLWAALDAISGQKFIATHSGDLLARVPLSAVRRFCKENGVTVVKSLQPGTLTAEEERKVDFHVQMPVGNCCSHAVGFSVKENLNFGYSARLLIFSGTTLTE